VQVLADLGPGIEVQKREHELPLKSAKEIACGSIRTLGIYVRMRSSYYTGDAYARSRWLQISVERKREHAERMRNLEYTN